MATSSSKQARPAAKTDAEAEVEASPKPRRKKSGILKILLLLIVLLGLAGGGAWYFLRDGHSPEEDKSASKSGTSKAAHAKAASNKPPVFVPLEQFTVNLQSEESSPQFLQVNLVVKATDSAVADAIKLHMPEIRDRVLMLLSSKRPSEITSPEGKKTLGIELTREITAPIANNIPEQSIDSVLFTSFVVQ